jgi:hypothetical protein
MNGSYTSSPPLQAPSWLVVALLYLLSYMNRDFNLPYCRVVAGLNTVYSLAIYYCGAAELLFKP